MKKPPVAGGYRVKAFKRWPKFAQYVHDVIFQTIISPNDLRGDRKILIVNP